MLIFQSYSEYGPKKSYKISSLFKFFRLSEIISKATDLCVLSTHTNIQTNPCPHVYMYMYNNISELRTLKWLSFSFYSFQFFDYIAETVQTFKSSLELGSEECWLSFCFAFPHKLNSIDSGILVNWTKNFNVQGVVGQDVVALLQKALDKKNVISFSVQLN